MAASWAETFPPAPGWTEKDMEDQTGRVFLITGGSSGIGFETAKILYHLNGTVYITSRSASSAEAAVQSILSFTPHASQVGKSARGTLKYLILNLSDLSTIKSSATTLLKEVNRLDVVWHNAGVMIPNDPHILTAQGYHQQLGINSLAPFLFQHFLTPLMLATASLPSTEPNSVRVIWVSSSGHRASPMPDGVSWDNVNLENGKTGMRMNIERYGQSKAMIVIQAHEFARLYHAYGKGVVSLSLHPGALSTGLQKNAPRWFNTIFSVLRREPRFGALTELFAGIRPLEKGKEQMLEDGGWNGGYILPFGVFGAGSKDVFDGILYRETGPRLWALCVELVKDFL